VSRQVNITFTSAFPLRLGADNPTVTPTTPPPLFDGNLHVNAIVG
jgi:hypothetical protein